ncbi:hypothetical protein CWI39_1298p0010 [Hamiltosporidium magnivora]|uniref:Uncharacterized protein n=1 Tax=Hamiltosporidium magnivora TaxID=148818 RepID=A0A4Q9L2X9_9MICR|nr:hypothetical protein CWI39_1298p0010 [Hamiltosporidium magnivora]
MNIKSKYEQEISKILGKAMQSSYQKNKIQQLITTAIEKTNILIENKEIDIYEIKNEFKKIKEEIEREIIINYNVSVRVSDSCKIKEEIEREIIINYNVSVRVSDSCKIKEEIEREIIM